MGFPSRFLMSKPPAVRCWILNQSRKNLLYYAKEYALKQGWPPSETQSPLISFRCLPFLSVKRVLFSSFVNKIVASNAQRQSTGKHWCSRQFYWLLYFLATADGKTSCRTVKRDSLLVQLRTVQYCRSISGRAKGTSRTKLVIPVLHGI